MTSHAAAPLESVLPAVLPLGFASDFPEVPYAAKGTCFLMRRRRRLWLVSASHAIGNDTGYLMVPVNADAVEWLELGFACRIEASEGNEDSAAADLTVLRVLNHWHPSIARPLDLDAWAFTEVASPGDRVIIVGFPAAGLANTIYYEEDAGRVVVSRQRFLCEAAYVMPDPSAENLHIVRLGTLGKVPSVDGLSGSPVFLKHGDHFSFAGVLLRGGPGAFGTARFVQASFLLALIDGALAGPDQAATIVRGR